jgi:CRP/FNR family transcriptional regulator, nitrogen oxide reductase regulator
VVESQLLEGLTGPDVHAVLAAATTRRCSSEETVYEQGSFATECYLLTHGRARYFSITPDGRKMLLHWLKPGDTLGVASVLQRTITYRVGAETIRDSSMLVWSRRSMLRLIDQHPRLLHNLLSISAEYLDVYVAAHGAMVSNTARQRLASLLVHLTEALGRAVPGGVELQATNEELANAANITLFTASRILSEWQTAGALTKGRGRIVLHSPKRLFRLTA